MSRPAVAVALLVLPVAASACGGTAAKSPTEPTATTAATAPEGAVAAAVAVAKTVAAGSEHVDIVASVVTNAKPVRLVGSGDFDTASRRGSIHAKLAIAGTNQTLDEVQDGTTIYLKSPLVAPVLPAGKTWLQLDLAAAGRTFGADASALAAQDPAAVLEQLQAVASATKVGTQTVAGTQTTHYRGRIDTSKLPQATTKALAAGHVTFGPYQVWTGADGYVHRLEVTTTSTTSSQTVKTVLTMTLSKFGEASGVSLPPASQTLDARNLSLLGSGN